MKKKIDRKMVEKNRRIQMKSLCSNLISLVPPTRLNPSKSNLSQEKQISCVISYIKELKETVEKLEEKKKEILAMEEKEKYDHFGPIDDDDDDDDSMLPLVELRELKSNNTIEVMVISGLKKKFMFNQLISIVEEEGGQVVSASFSTLGNKIFHSLHAQAKISRVGVETSRVRERLQQLVR